MMIYLTTLALLATTITANPLSDTVRATTASEYDELRTHALWSSVASCPDQITSWSCLNCRSPNLAGAIPITQLSVDDTGVHGYMALHPPTRTIVIGFRGSKDWSSWQEDLKIHQEPFQDLGPDSAVHAGFKAAFTSIQDEVRAQLSSLIMANRVDGYSVHVVGHSLGAAIALLVGQDLARLAPGTMPQLTMPVRVRSFSSPRVGNKAFVDAVNAISTLDNWRLVNGNDEIPHLPPTWMEYEHTDREFWIKKVGVDSQPGDVVRCRSGLGEDPQCSAQIKFALPSQKTHTFMLGVKLNGGQGGCTA